ncbi:hypothetical protein [Edaphobacter sp.]|uniref:hypothetical protein n=1 Tax=Edaphobacter sp. TaxID=1934404 RepID=UPI002DBF3E44|nr:hypothetical protein [Edaphobacter sp.]HEU5340063.1 hypothetical protein [Edaphobacter sp.]
MSKQPSDAQNLSITTVNYWGLLYLPLLLASICIPQDLFRQAFRDISSLFPMASFVVGFVLLCVLALSAIGFFDQYERSKRLFRAGIGFGAFAFIYLAGNGLGVKGGIWYFLHFNVLLLLLLNEEIAGGDYRGDLSMLIWWGHRIVGAVLVIAFLAHTHRSTWVALDYVVGTYFALFSWKSLKKSRDIIYCSQ